MGSQHTAISHQLWVVLLVILCAACISKLPQHEQLPTDELPNIELFDDPECMVGCWRGIHLGQVTVAELRSHPTLLSANSSYPFRNPTQYEFDNNGIYFVYLDGNMRLTIVATNSWIGLTLSDVVDALGEPEYALYRYGETSYGDMEILELTLRLYYPQQGYSFALQESSVWDTTGLDVQFEFPNLNVCVENTAAVSAVVVYEPASINQIIQRYNNIADSLIPWTGFGCHDVPYTERLEG
jgi:hypothetical protein